MSIARGWTLGIAAVFVLMVALCSLLVAGTLICPKCGFENEDGRPVCVHCEAELVKKAEPPKADTAPTGELPVLAGKLRFLEPATVEEEIAEGRGYMDSKPEVARLFLVNAQALEMLTDPSGESGRADQIERLIKRCGAGLERIRIKCPTCQGTGRRPFAATSLKGEQTAQDGIGPTCSECSGTGWVTRRAGLEDIRFRKARGADDYRQAQQARKFVPIGDAWVPQDLEVKLTVRQQAKIRRITAAPCPTCAGLGRLDCPTCHGDGRVKCATCQGTGHIKVNQRDARVVKIKDKVEQVCGVCGGAGFVKCDPCGGRGSVLCSKCGGSGQGGQCSRCAGQGFAMCDKCNGTGRVKQGLCDECGGEGALLCTSCRGDGRKR